MKIIRIIVLLALLAAWSHDARRENPLDPELTPGVELTVTVNDTAGTAALTWTRYEGAQPFAAYVVLRHVTNTTVVDTLGRITNADSVAFLDASLAFDTSYQYRVSVDNTTGFSAQSAAVQTQPLTPSALGPILARTDSTAGTITVRWNRYGGPGFAGYRIHRRPTGTDRDSVLTRTTTVTDTVFVDAGAIHETDYSYQIVVQAGGQDLLSGTVEARLSLLGSAITHLAFTSVRAVAELAWSPYAGPRFAAYHVERYADDALQVLAVIEDVAATTMVDSALLGATGYRYQVKVLTDLGEVISSPAAVGGIHPPITAWNVPVAAGSHMRLHPRSGGGVEALVSSSRDIRLLLYDQDGQLLEEQVLLSIPGGDFSAIKTKFSIEPQSVGTLLSADGERFVLLTPTGGGQTALLHFDAGGQPLTSVIELFSDESLPSGAQRIALQAAELVTGGEGTAVRFDNVGISANEIGQRHDDFNDGAGEWQVVPSLASPTDGNNEGFRSVELTDGALFYTGLNPISVNVLVAAMGDPTWTDVHIEADLVLLDSGVAGVRVGYGFGPRIYFVIDSYEQLARLTWRANSTEQALLFFKVIERPLPVIPGLTYRLSLGSADNEPIVTVASPIRWYADASLSSEYATLSIVGETVAITSGADAYSMGPDGQTLAYDPFDTPVAETRVWRTGRTQSIGVALPLEHRIAFSRTSVSLMSGRLSFPGLFGTSEIGTGLGNGAGEFAFPLSFDVAADGRFYVLDAGNSRIQVFDSDGAYITQWGNPGSDAGEFDFSPAGGGDFAGSIAVDDDGFIYVADVGNGRIQKFAP